MKLYYANVENIGDQLSPLIVSALSGGKVDLVQPECSDPYFSVIGSCLGWISENATVYGTGVLHRQARPPAGATYLAVRGPLSRQRVLAASGDCPEVFGDAAIFAPQLWPVVEQNPTERLLIVLHRHEFRHRREIIQADAPAISTIGRNPLTFAKRLATAAAVVSSSLHGLILAHAYGIPAAWVKPTDLPMGDGTKFRDYLQSAGLPDAPIVGPLTNKTLDRAMQYASLPAHDFQDFRAALPFH